MLDCRKAGDLNLYLPEQPDGLRREWVVDFVGIGIPPSPSSSTTGISSHALTNPSIRPSLTHPATLFINSASGISPK